MGSQQGDDLQLNGDLACENAEIRGQLLVNGSPVTPSSGTKAIIVYAPGLVSPVAPYYNTWSDVEAQINALSGAAQLWVDQTGLGGFAQVPATANLDGQGRLEIIGKGPQGEAELQIADGGQIKNVQTWRTIVVRAAPNARPALLYDIDGMIVECFDATFLFGAAATLPVMQLDNAITYISFFFTDSSELRNSHNPGNAVLDLGPNLGVLCLLCIDTLFFPSSFTDTIGGVVGQTLQIQTDSSVATINLGGTFGGTLTQTNIDTPGIVAAIAAALPDIVDTPGVSIDLKVPTTIDAPAGAPVQILGASVPALGALFQVTSDGVNNASLTAYAQNGAFEMLGFANGTTVIGGPTTRNNQQTTESVIECDTSAGNVVFTGFELVAFQQLHAILVIRNQGNANGTVTLKHEDPASLASNRIRIAGGTDLVIPQDGCATLLYGASGFGNRWQVIGEGFGSNVAPPTSQTVLFTDFTDKALVTFDVSAGCVGDLEAGNPLAWPNIGLGTLFVNAAAGVHSRVYPVPGTASPKPIALDSVGFTRAIFQTKLQLTSPPNAGADYRLCAGWSGNSSPNGSGLFFQTGFNALGNGNFWATVNCGPSGDPNPVDTGVPVNGNPRTLMIDYEHTINRARFYIDGALVATFSTVPDPFNFTGVYAYFVGLDYTAPLGVRGAQQMWIDWLYFQGNAAR